MTVVDVSQPPVRRYKTGRTDHTFSRDDCPPRLPKTPVCSTMELLPRLREVVLVLWLLICSSGSAAKLTSGTNGTSQQDSIVRDCSDLPYGSASGVYNIHPDGMTPTPVYCDMDDGEGWTVFQRRADITPRQDFFQDWEAYKWGLGILDGEFWWGLHYLWQLTSKLDRVYELRVDLRDWDDLTAYATYQKFTIASEADGYRLNLTGYVGSAGDGLAVHNGMKFTTFDRDQDVYSGNCATECQGAWWYHECFYSNLNGRYIPESPDMLTFDITVRWDTWRNECLKATTMKIRPTKKL